MRMNRGVVHSYNVLLKKCETGTLARTLSGMQGKFCSCQQLPIMVLVCCCSCCFCCYQHGRHECGLATGLS